MRRNVPSIHQIVEGDKIYFLIVLLNRASEKSLKIPSKLLSKLVCVCLLMCESNILFHYFSVHNSPSKTHHELFCSSSHHHRERCIILVCCKHNHNRIELSGEGKKEGKKKARKEFAMWMTDLLKQNIFMCLYEKEERKKKKRRKSSRKHISGRLCFFLVWENDSRRKRNLLHAARWRADVLHAPIV